MLRCNKLLPELLLLGAVACCAFSPRLMAQSAAPAPAASADAQNTAASDEQPLKPEDLVVPSNAALEAIKAETPPPAPAAAPNGNANLPPSNQPVGQVMQQGKNGLYTMRAEVDEVILHATVVDKHDRMVTNLDRNDFTVFENGQQQPITSFRHEDVPVAVGILVDDSGSMRDKRPAVEQAALNFVRASNPDDRVFVVNFSDPQDIYIDADFTASIPKLQAALENIDSRGETALYDAVAASADHIMQQPGIDHKLSKKVLLVITDGWDNASSESLEQCIRRVAVDGGPTVYTIGLLDQDDKRKGKRALKELAEQTGGVAYLLDPGDLSKVDEVTQEIAHDIRNQYTIGYKRPAAGGSGYRTIKVLARGPHDKDLQVRTRSGYFPGQERASE